MSLHRLILALLLLLVPATAQAQNFPKLTGRVVDAANLLSPEQEAQLTQLSADVEKASSRQLVVATIPDLQDYPIEDYGYRLGRAWNIGQSEANNGIVLIVAPKERKVRIEVGYGLEPIMTDGFSGDIIRETILPKFRDGDMAGGIVAGAGAIGEQMKLPLEAAEARVKAKLDQTRASPSKRRSGEGAWVAGFIALFWIAVVVIGIIAAVAGRRRGGRRYRSAASDVGEILLWTAINAAMNSRGGGGGGSSWGGGGGSSWGGGGGGGGFSGGGGSFGGGGASGSW